MWYCHNTSCDENGIGKEGHGPDVLGDLEMRCGTCGEPCAWQAAQAKPAPAQEV
jgi:hypothetical protein